VQVSEYLREIMRACQCVMPVCVLYCVCIACVRACVRACVCASGRMRVFVCVKEFFLSVYANLYMCVCMCAFGRVRMRVYLFICHVCICR